MAKFGLWVLILKNKKYLSKDHRSKSTSTKDMVGVPVLKLLHHRPVGVLAPMPMSNVHK